MKIALCDDEHNCLSTLKSFIINYSTQCNIHLQVDSFTCGKDLILANLTSPYEIIFMDIFIGNENGIDIIKELNPSQNQQIVFTTTSHDFAIEAFGLNAVHYLVKPITSDSITQALDRCVDRLGHSRIKMLDIRTTIGPIPIPMERIQYIEVFNKKCEIHTQRCIYQTYTSLDSIYEMLDQSFFLKAQRSYIVNMFEIESFLFDHIILKNGLEITLSRSYRSALKQIYQNFLFDLARRDTI